MSSHARLAPALLLLPWLLASLLVGCGFHLEGGGPLPHSIALVRIETNDTESDFYFGLRKALLDAGTRIDEGGHDDSATVIHVLNDSTAQRILTVSALNVPTEYELSYSLKFSVTSMGRDLIQIGTSDRPPRAKRFDRAAHPDGLGAERPHRIRAQLFSEILGDLDGTRSDSRGSAHIGARLQLQREPAARQGAREANLERSAGARSGVSRHAAPLEPLAHPRTRACCGSRTSIAPPWRGCWPATGSICAWWPLERRLTARSGATARRACAAIRCSRATTHRCIRSCTRRRITSA